MITYDKKHLLFRVECDECGATFHYDPRDVDSLRSNFTPAEWYETNGIIEDGQVWQIGGKDYCTECAQELFRTPVWIVIRQARREKAEGVKNAGKDRVNHEGNQG